MKLFQHAWLKYLGFALGALLSTMAGAKPLAPVQVSITPLTTGSQGRALEFEVRAQVNMDVDNLQIVVLLPQAVQLSSGDLHWQGPLLNGEEKRLRFTAQRLPTAEPGGEEPLIEVQAVIFPAASVGQSAAQEPAQLAANAVYRWQTGLVGIAASHKPPLNSRVVRRNGITVQEYELGR